MFIRLEVIAISDRELARQAATPAADVLGAGQLRLAPVHTDDARAQHRDERRRAQTPRGIGEERTHAVRLSALDVDQEHVGRVGADLDGELGEQAGLQRSHADDEERAQPDCQQDHARLIPGARQMQHRVAQRKGA